MLPKLVSMNNKVGFFKEIELFKLDNVVILWPKRGVNYHFAHYMCRLFKDKGWVLGSVLLLAAGNTFPYDKWIC